MEMIQIPSKTIEEETFLIDNENDLLNMVYKTLGIQAEEIIKKYIKDADFIDETLNELYDYEERNDKLENIIQNLKNENELLKEKYNQLKNLSIQAKESDSLVKIVPKKVNNYYIFGKEIYI